MTDKKSDLIKIDISRDKLTATIKVLGSEVPSRQDVLDALKIKGVVYGVLEKVVDFCSTIVAEDLMVIAKGDPPVAGKNGWVEILWEQPGGQAEAEDSARTIDYRETSKLVSVNEGTLLARRHPPVKGEPGKAVTGEVVLPPEAREARIVAGRGVRLEDGEDKAVSAIQGRPLAKKAGPTMLVTVEPSYTVVGDVSMKTGNIRFKGDVIVTGNITETMSLEASGSVKVNGIVTGANVFCGESLSVQKNVISSSITAGMGAVECGKIKYLMQDLYAELTSMVELLDQIRHKLVNVDRMSFGQVVNGLIENRFKNVRVYAKQLIHTKTFNLPFEVADALESIKIITGVQFSQEEFRELMYHLDQAVKVMNSQETRKAKVVVNSAHGSTIKCSGEVLVTGKGCVNTTIYALGNVKINGPFKGGEVYSEGNVEIDELGSNLGAPPLVRIKSKSYVKVNRVLPGSIIQIGANRINLTRELSAAKYRLSSDGETIEIV